MSAEPDLEPTKGDFLKDSGNVPFRHYNISTALQCTAITPLFHEYSPITLVLSFPSLNYERMLQPKQL